MNTKYTSHVKVSESFLAEHAAVALREMRRLASLHDTATDDMIHAAMYLAGQLRPKHDRASGFGLFTPPLRALTASDIYEETYLAEPHVSAVRALVRQRGGITAPAMPGLQEALQTYVCRPAA